MSIYPLDQNAQKRLLRKSKQQFGPLQTSKFEKWFAALDTNDNGLVSVDELSNAFLSAGVMRRKKDITNIFRLCDIDNSRELSFEEFVAGIKNITSAGKLYYDKLDALVDESNALAAATILSQQRRNVLMRCVVTGAEKRLQEVDSVWAASQQRRDRGKRVGYIDLSDSRKESKSLEALSRSHKRYMQRAKDVVMTLQPIVLQSSRSFDADKKPKLQHQVSSRSIDLIEDIIGPDLLLLSGSCSSTSAQEIEGPRPVLDETDPSGKIFETQSSLQSELPLETPPCSARNMPPSLLHDSGKIKLVRSGFVVDMTSPKAEKFPIRDKNKITLNTTAACHKSKKIRLGPIRSSPIEVKGGLREGASKFYVSKQNKYSLRRAELPK